MVGNNIDLKHEYPDIYDLWCRSNSLDYECYLLIERSCTNEELIKKRQEAKDVWDEYLFAAKLVKDYNENRT